MSNHRADTNQSSSLASGEDQEKYWCGQPPCVSCFSHRGCRDHNPTRLHVYRNALLPPKKPSSNTGLLCGLCTLWKSVFSGKTPPEYTSVTQGQSGADTKPIPFFQSRLSFDPGSVKTLAPIHPSMPYHLAFYHLECARRNLSPSTEVAFISELSCSGSARFYEGGPEYTWSSDIYFNNGTFLQKQEIHCVLDSSTDCNGLKFNECPHIPFSVGRPSFSETEGWLVAKCRLTFPPKPDGETLGSRNWNSKQGRFTRISMCSSCHSDHEQILEVIDNKLHLRNTCYRDLGSAKDRSQPRWVSLLNGSRSGAKRFCDDSVYGHVWRTAREFGRPNLHLVIHNIGYSEYDASVATR